jgi:hypothetical protein
MNCERFEELISDYLEGQLSPSLRAELEQHRASCPGCASLISEVQQVIVLCRSYPEAEPPITLPERILSATLGERRKISLRHLFDLSILRRAFSPQFAVAVALLFCLIGLAIRIAGPEPGGQSGMTPAILSRLDIYTHKIYSESVRLYNTKNQILAEYDYFKTSLFNQIDYHLSQLSGQIKEPAAKPPSPPADKQPGNKEEMKKSSLLDFFA